MIPVPSGVRVWLAVGRTDMRKGMNGLALQVQEALGRDPHAGDLYVFRGARGGLIKIIWHDGVGMSLYAKRLEHGRFVWPSPADGTLAHLGRAAGLYARRHRLAKPAAYLAADQRRIRSRFLQESAGRVRDSLPVMDADLAALPDDIDALKAALAIERARIREVLAERDARAAELAVARAKASEDLALIAHQKLRIAQLERQLYGPRSERSERLIDQLALQFEEFAASASRG